MGAVGLTVLALLAILFVAGRPLRVVPDGFVHVIERSGRRVGTLPPGVHRVMPFVDTSIVVSTRPQSINVELRLLTADYVSVRCSGRCEYSIASAIPYLEHQAVFERDHVRLVEQELRSLVQLSAFDDLVLHAAAFEARCRVQLDQRMSRYGLEVIAFDILGVEPEGQIAEAMAGLAADGPQLQRDLRRAQFRGEELELLAVARANGYRAIDNEARLLHPRSIRLVEAEMFTDAMRSATFMAPWPAPVAEWIERTTHTDEEDPPRSLRAVS
jgi:regulator of protease activity HflC (stomatin/prohibitin superfamily)